MTTLLLLVTTKLPVSVCGKWKVEEDFFSDQITTIYHFPLIIKMQVKVPPPTLRVHTVPTQRYPTTNINVKFRIFPVEDLT